MVYRGLGFLEVVRFGSSPTPSPVSITSTWRHTGRLRKRDNFVRGEGERGCGRSRIMRPQESLFVNKSFYTLWVCQTYKACRRKSKLILYSRRERKRIKKKHRSERQNKKRIMSFISDEGHNQKEEKGKEQNNGWIGQKEQEQI